MLRSARLVFFSQLSLGLFLLVCLALMPRFLFEADEGGISNYGVYLRTIIPYTLAFGLCGVLLLEAAQALPERALHRQPLQKLLYSIGALNLLMLETTYMYQVNTLLDAIHIYSGNALFIAEIAAGIWLWHAFKHDKTQTVMLAVQLSGFFLLVLTLFGLLHVLFIAEVVASAGFGALLVWTVNRAN